MARLLTTVKLGAFGVSLDAAGKNKPRRPESSHTTSPVGMIREAVGCLRGMAWSRGRVRPQNQPRTRASGHQEKIEDGWRPQLLAPMGCAPPLGADQIPPHGRRRSWFGEIRPSQQTSVGRVLTKGKGRQQKRDAHAINVNGQLGISCP